MNRSEFDCFVFWVLLFLNSGTFTQAGTLPIERFILGAPMVAATSSSTRLTTSDVNNDGYPDIAAAHAYRVAGLYVNQAYRSFSAEHVISEPWWDVAKSIGASSIALGDLDLDGNIDMVIPIYGNHFVEHMIQLYRGNGDGTFQLWPVDGYNAWKDLEGADQDGINDGIILAQGATNPMFAKISDFDGDGRPDIVVSGNNGLWSVDLLIQSSDQKFSISDSDRAGQNPQFFDVGDFNGDSAPDLVVGALYTGVLVFINKADGSGTLTKLGGTYLSRYHQFVIVADFNGDGLDDIAARGERDALVYILYGNGTGHFPSSASYPVSGNDGYLAAADIDNDGDQDLIVASTSAKNVDVLLNDGNGTFSSPESTKLNAAPWGLAANDFDQDGSVDIAVSCDDNTIQILWNTTTARDLVGVWRPSTGQFFLDSNENNRWDGAPYDAMFKVPFALPTDTPVIGDWNGDGKDEIGWWRLDNGKFYLDANKNNIWDGPTGGDIVTGKFQRSTDMPVTGDWNGDGKDEVGWWRPETGRFFLDANGNNIWDGPTGGDIVTGKFRRSTDMPVTGDWNGDGKDEVGWWRPETGRFFLDANGNNIWDGPTGGDIVTGKFQRSTDMPVTGDWNGDGKDEVGWWRPETGRFFLDANGNNKWDGRGGGDIISAPFGDPTDIPVIGKWGR